MRDKNGFIRIAALFQDPVAELLRTLREVLPTPSTPQAGATTDSASWTGNRRHGLAVGRQGLLDDRDIRAATHRVEFGDGQFAAFVFSLVRLSSRI